MAHRPHANRLFAPDGAPAVANAPAETRSQISTSITAALRRGLLAKYFGALDGEAELGRDIRAICRAAENQNMRIEYLIVAIKDAWRTLPEARTLPESSQGRDFLDHVVSLCITAYFSADRAD